MEGAVPPVAVHEIGFGGVNAEIFISKGSPRAIQIRIV